ncbi:hypothetical protein [Bacteriovorax sp. DB6_IX]|uniref:hypothetical protein n=2 Tax=Bacteriovorax sp. DB6_IX TaxID=1353530 RepID=UPI000389E60E|nr:hypothetical protein [Bacteriovorax sp. DB6_IX]EQC50648.1 hypothetical protein M901_0556 [Bacteriovorax sp. DB6_IX]
MDTNNLLIYLLIFVVILLLVVVGALTFFIYMQYSKEKNNSSSKTTATQAEKQSLNIKEILEESKLQSEKTVGLCSICEKTLIESTHYEIDNLHFCKDHFNLYTKNEWIPITNQRTTADTPEAGVYIYNFKKELWEKSKEPCYIQCESKLMLQITR